MSWNNGYETKSFRKRMERQAEEYRRLGMTEDQIRKIEVFDYEVFRSDKRYTKHTQWLDPITEEMDSELQSSLLKRCADRLTVRIEPSMDEPFWWINELEDECLWKAIESMTQTQKLILTLYAFEGKSQKEIAESFGRSQQDICKHLRCIKNKLHKYGFGPKEVQDEQ